MFPLKRSLSVSYTEYHRRRASSSARGGIYNIRASLTNYVLYCKFYAHGASDLEKSGFFGEQSVYDDNVEYREGASRELTYIEFIALAVSNALAYLLGEK